MSSIPTLSASPYKLRDGTWGARVIGACVVGDRVTVTARSGKTWPAEVADVVWSGFDRETGAAVALVRTRDVRRAASAKRGAYDRYAGVHEIAKHLNTRPWREPYEPAEGEVCSSPGCLGAPDSDGLCPRCADLRDTVAEFNAMVPPAPVAELPDCPTTDELPPMWTVDDLDDLPIAPGDAW